MSLIPFLPREYIRLRPASSCVAVLALAASIAIVVFPNDDSARPGLPLERRDNQGRNPEDATYLMQSMPLVVEGSSPKLATQAADLDNAAPAPASHLQDRKEQMKKHHEEQMKKISDIEKNLEMSMMIGLLKSLAGGLGGGLGGNSTMPLLGALGGGLMGGLGGNSKPSLSTLETHSGSSFLRLVIVACLVAMACACFFVLVPYAAKDLLRRPSNEPVPNTVNSALTASRLSSSNRAGGLRNSTPYAVISNSSSSPASSPDASSAFTQDLSGTLPSLMSPPIPHIRVSMFGGMPQYGSRLGIPISDMARISQMNAGELCVVADFAASPVMWVNVSKAPGNRFLKVYVDQQRKTPVVELKPDSTGFMGGNSALEIFGGGFFYGHLETEANKNFVTHAGVKELTIEGETDPFEIKVTKTRSGKQVAAVRKNDDFMGTDPYIEFGILKPAEEDTVLILSCVLAVMFLQRRVMAM